VVAMVKATAPCTFPVTRIRALSFNSIDAVVEDAALNIVGSRAVGVRVGGSGSGFASRGVLACSVVVPGLAVPTLYADIPRVCAG